MAKQIIYGEEYLIMREDEVLAVLDAAAAAGKSKK